MGDRVVRVEALVEQLLKKGSNDSERISECATGKDDGKPSHGILTPASISSESSQVPALYKPSAVRIQYQKAIHKVIITHFLN